MADFSKVIKIISYACVITSEHDLSRFHGRGMGFKKSCDGLIGGPKLN